MTAFTLLARDSPRLLRGRTPVLSLTATKFTAPTVKEAVKKRDLDDNNLVSRSPWWWSRDTLSSWISSFW